jgi:hypothetical protein
MDGTAVDTSSDEHRRDCEARTVMRWPREARANFYRQVRERRGEARAQQLIDDVNRLWRQQRQEAIGDA